MKEFKIPAGICKEAKQFIQELLVNKFVAADDQRLIVLAWVYHNWWKSIECPEVNCISKAQLFQLFI